MQAYFGGLWPSARRDPRARLVTGAYLALATSPSLPVRHAGTDIADARRLGLRPPTSAQIRAAQPDTAQQTRDADR